MRRGLTFAAGAGVPLLLARPVVAARLREATLQAVHQPGIVSPAVAALMNAAGTWTSRRMILAAAALGLVGTVAGWTLLPASPEQTTDPAGPAQVARADEQGPLPKPDRFEEPLPERAVARLGSSRLRIGNSAFALTPDGRVIVTVSPEGLVRRFDANTGRLLEYRRLTDRGDVDPLGQSGADLAADARTVAIDESSAGHRRLTVWDVASGKILLRLAPGGGVMLGGPGGYSLSPDGKRLAICELTNGRDATQKLRVYDVHTGHMKELGDLEYNVYAVRLTADGKRVLVSQTSATGSGSTFACFDFVAGKQLWRLPRKGQEFAVSPDGKTLIAAVWDQTGFQVIETDPDSGRPTESFKPCRGAHPNVRLVIAPDNRTVVMNHFEEFRVWDLATAKEIRRFPSPKASGRGYGPVLGAMSADGRTFVTNLGYLQRWDLTTGKPFFEAPTDDGLGGPIEHLAFNANGKEVIGSAWSLTSARWDVATGKRIASTQHERLGHQLILTPDGVRAIRADSYKRPYEVTVIDPVAGKVLHLVRWAEPKEVGGSGLRAYALTADGKTLLIAHGNEPDGPAQSYVTACAVASGRRLVRFSVPGAFNYYRQSPFSPCGRWVVLGGKVYHVGTGTELFTPAGDSGERLLPGDRWGNGPVWFSADGRLMAGWLARQEGPKLTDTGTLAVWELASGTVLARFPKAGFVRQVALAPDDRTLAVVDGRGIRVADLLTGKQLAAYRAPDVTCDTTDRGCGTQTLVFAPDGRTLATGHRDGAVLLWRAPQPARDGSGEITPAERDRLWADLGSDAPGTGRAAVARLARHPATAVALLKVHFRPPAMPPDASLAALIKDLDSDVFDTREEAARKLREQGSKAEPALRKELAGSPSLEVRRRIEGILAALSPPLLRLPISGETLRGIRAIEVLERAGTREARALLQSWVEQAQNPHLAVEARVVLERLGPKTD
jgi:WD40 repeat protein